MELLCFETPNGRKLWVDPSTVTAVTPLDHTGEAEINRILKKPISADTRQMSNIKTGGAFYLVLDPDDTVGEQINNARKAKQFKACNPLAPPASESGEASGEESPR